MKFKKKQKREARRFAEYFVSGGAQFWSGYAAFAVLFSVLGVNFWWAKSLSYFLGVTVNYVLERFWVFKRKNVTKKQIKTSASKFYLLMFVNFLLDLGIVGGLRELGLTPYIGQFLSAGFFTIWNYLLFKLWVFAQARPPRRSGVRQSRTRKRRSQRSALSDAPVRSRRTKKYASNRSSPLSRTASERASLASFRRTK